MAASEIQHKRWSKDVAWENRKYCLRDKGRYDAFTIKEDADVIFTSTRISSTRMRNNTSQGLFVHMHGQINTSVICHENRVVCIANGLFFSLRPCHSAVSRITARGHTPITPQIWTHISKEPRTSSVCAKCLRQEVRWHCRYKTVSPAFGRMAKKYALERSRIGGSAQCVC